jgi:hypothetical protein
MSSLVGACFVLLHGNYEQQEMSTFLLLVVLQVVHHKNILK